ncbi:transporter substrate-binding domain-containing protein [Agrobacterium rubi]|uniref:Transporter substrate-binding domain-containing protein n=1 Tax=Agrobacterium rubi TaxID=28099 RepID=A0AAE7R096_9HYPH|nr:transporter substrate-binding domain-containing protein [Agrobacterium rubi]NTE89239.1 transporter substrate-binding domain-containing protein [Agrobacterium rubi]NTF05021.1 transporter substrate-binding domain-containing protein [Agrobacterium rubi]NTF38791.1 transporter substrate-binding domain-containing protein [Agrobacterium rubi]QTF99884.1 transporter substrate-binding domain-containing protein [Agrobacterium rubi]
MKFAYLIEPPFNYRNKQCVLTGSDVELARTVLSMIGIENVEFIETEFSNLLSGLEQHRWDMTTGLFDTPERRKIAAFSRPIWALSDGLLVRKGNPEQLSGYASIAVNSEYKLTAIHDQVQHKAALAAGIPEDRIVLNATYDEAANAVLEGRVDAYASVAIAHQGYLKQNLNTNLDVIPVPLEERAAAFGAFGFRQSDSELKDAVDAALTQCLGSDEHRTMMRNHGFTDADIDMIAPHRTTLT